MSNAESKLRVRNGKQMNRLHEGLGRNPVQKTRLETISPDAVPDDLVLTEIVNNAQVDGMKGANGSRKTAETRQVLEIEDAPTVRVLPSPGSRLVAWGEYSLGAERFRALAIRLDDLRKQNQLTSVQVTSSVINEGKTFVAANLAVTLAKYSASRTLLVEGDLHRPTLASLFGLKDMPGLSDWWANPGQDIAQYIVRFEGTGLWFLPAGKAYHQPSEILHSPRLQEAFALLASRFDWTVVDSTPMLPVIDANLWSRLVDGTLLVVRQGVAPLKALKEGLQSLDRPKLVGVVVNEVSNQMNYDGQYYGPVK